MDDPLPSTPVGDTIFEEVDDSTQLDLDPKNDSVILAQPVMEKPVSPLILSTEDPPHETEIPSTQDTQNPLKDDENLPIQDVQNPIVQLSYFQ